MGRGSPMRRRSRRSRRSLGRLPADHATDGPGGRVGSGGGGEHERLGFLFVLTYGRSGSTLLQGILNSVPGYVIRGENRQMLRHLWRFEVDGREERAFQRRLRLRHRELSTRPTNPYFGIDHFPLATSRAGVRRLALDTLLRPGPGTRVTGFKEIRWEDDDVAEFVGWLREVFPGARFLVNTRDLDDVARSKWWADEPDARAHLEDVERRLLALAADLGPAAYRVHYDDYVADPDILVGLFAWLGETWDPDAVRRTLSQRHSY